MNSQKRRLVLSASFIPVLLVGCTPARMALRPELAADATELKVEGRKNFSFDETFSFGDYRVTEVRRGWTRSDSVSLTMLENGKLKFSTSEATQKYEFAMKHGEGDVWKCQSVTDVEQDSIGLSWAKNAGSGIDITAKSSFVSTFKSASKPEVWRLAMNENYESRGIMKGVLSDGKNSIVIQGTRKMAGFPLALSEYTGFEFLMNGQVIGSVQVINKGAVWLMPSLDEKLHAPLAVTSAALLLYQDIKK